ncbi:DNA primase [Tepidibacter formicigenes]|uniref:DNA primase n=1 Tax=Tepidibacter formicigenes DSM 15518 TaxID=1123349 RepID=A0A1M6PGL8_9FIRM|nr:DNA primase [Tepidibacter formicigenes]SHK07091.1 DNA primase [Tepidibacter formicigenes DSM 15518]
MSDIQHIIEEVKERNDIVDIISSYVQVTSAGANYKAVCPFHSENTPSFVISPQKQMYKCFGCGEGGDVINFIMKIENLDFMEALEFLGEKVGIEINKGKMDNKAKEIINKKQKLYEIHLDSARYFFNALFQNKNKGYEYFKRRGLNDKTIKYFGLGYAYDNWDNLTKYLLSKGYKESELMESGLILEKKNKNGYIDRFRDRIIFPIFDVRGKVIGFGGRVLGDLIPKYLNSPETLIFNKRYNLYGLNFAKKYIQDETLIIVEGYMDVISLFQFGIKNVVASLGTALTKEQGKLIKRYANKVIMAYDSDEAGTKATLKGMNILKEVGLDVKILKFDEAKDPDEYIRKKGVNLFKKYLNQSVSLVQFKIDILKKDYNLDNAQEKVDFTKKVSKILKEIKSPIELEHYIKKISKETGISVNAIGSEVYGKYYNPRQFNQNETRKIEEIKIKKNGGQIAEKQLIKIFLENKDLRNLILLKLDIDDFLLEESREILNYIIKSKDLDIITIDKLKNINVNENFINEISDINIDSIDLNVTLEGMIKTLKRNSLKIKRDNLLNRQYELQQKKKIDKNINSSEVDRELLDIAMKIIQLEKELKDIL